jgi:hypothetical protein
MDGICAALAGAAAAAGAVAAGDDMLDVGDCMPPRRLAAEVDGGGVWAGAGDPSNSNNEPLEDVAPAYKMIYRVSE